MAFTQHFFLLLLFSKGRDVSAPKVDTKERKKKKGESSGRMLGNIKRRERSRNAGKDQRTLGKIGEYPVKSGDVGKGQGMQGKVKGCRKRSRDAGKDQGALRRWERSRDGAEKSESSRVILM
jgi:hypothetical protein